MARSRIEWLTIIGGLVTIVIVMVYCAIRIQITGQWLQEHRTYIQQRDMQWEAATEQVKQHLDAAEKTRLDSLQHLKEMQQTILEAVEKGQR